jgi:hypothetical protein
MNDEPTDAQVEAALRVMVDEGLLSVPAARVTDFVRDGMSPAEREKALTKLRAADDEHSEWARSVVRRALRASCCGQPEELSMCPTCGTCCNDDWHRR